MGLFDGIGSARPGGRDPFFNSGHEYQIELLDLSFFGSKNPKRKAESFFKVRAKVLKSTDPALRAGLCAAQLINLANGEPALGDVKAVCEAAMRAMARETGGDVAQAVVTCDEDVEALCDPSQPARGVILGLRTVKKETQKGGGFTQHFWFDSDDLIFTLPVLSDITAQPNPGTVTPPAGSAGAQGATG